MPETEPRTGVPPVTPAEKVLLEAWETFDEYDAKANWLQRRFRRLQMSILLVGIAAVLLVAVQKQIEFEIARQKVGAAERRNSAGAEAADQRIERLQKWTEALHWVVLGIPLLLSGLIAGAHTFRPGDKWVLLRGGAEAVKREIFRFRTRTGNYAGGADAPLPERVLFERLSSINDHLKRTEVNKCALETVRYDREPNGPRETNGKAVPGDNRLTRLNPEGYLATRVNDQIDFYSNRTRRFDSSITRATVLVLLFGAAGTYVAAVGWELWIPVATAAAAALTAYLRYTQSEETLINYSRARIDLKNIRAWWAVLSPDEQKDAANFNSLVNLTEQVLEDETAGWSQRMTDALTELTRKQAGRGSASDGLPQTAKTPHSPKR